MLTRSRLGRLRLFHVRHERPRAPLSASHTHTALHRSSGSMTSHDTALLDLDVRVSDLELNSPAQTQRSEPSEEPPAEESLFAADSDADTPDWLLEAESVLNSTSGGDASGETSPASPRPPPIATLRSKERGSYASRTVREPAARSFPTNESTPVLLGRKSSAGGGKLEAIAPAPREERCVHAQAEAGSPDDGQPSSPSGKDYRVAWKTLSAIYDGLLAPPSELPHNGPVVGMVLSAGAAVFLSCAMA